MLALFCLRLAVSLIGCLLLLSPAHVNPRFYRTHFLTALGLGVVALAFSWEAVGTWLGLALAAGVVLSFLGSLSWSLEGAPGGRLLIVLTLAALAAALCLAELRLAPEVPVPWLLLGSFTSSAVLGASTTAM